MKVRRHLLRLSETVAVSGTPTTLKGIFSLAFITLHLSFHLPPSWSTQQPFLRTLFASDQTFILGRSHLMELHANTPLLGANMCCAPATPGIPDAGVRAILVATVAAKTAHSPSVPSNNGRRISQETAP